ncbi:MAG: hypothetical protein AAF800_01670 [Planctomycetota bacterium]
MVLPVTKRLGTSAFAFACALAPAASAQFQTNYFDDFSIDPLDGRWTYVDLPDPNDPDRLRLSWVPTAQQIGVLTNSRNTEIEPSARAFSTEPFRLRTDLDFQVRARTVGLKPLPLSPDTFFMSAGVSPVGDPGRAIELALGGNTATVGGLPIFGLNGRGFTGGVPTDFYVSEFSQDPVPPTSAVTDLYLSYDASEDELYLSDTGFGPAEAKGTATDVIRNPSGWNAAELDVYVGARGLPIDSTVDPGFNAGEGGRWEEVEVSGTALLFGTDIREWIEFDPFDPTGGLIRFEDAVQVINTGWQGYTLDVDGFELVGEDAALFGVEGFTPTQLLKESLEVGAAAVSDDSAATDRLAVDLTFAGAPEPGVYTATLVFDTSQGALPIDLRLTVPEPGLLGVLPAAVWGLSARRRRVR